MISESMFTVFCAYSGPGGGRDRCPGRPHEGLRRQCGDGEEIILSKLAKNALKYPVEKSKGNARKYTEF